MPSLVFAESRFVFGHDAEVRDAETLAVKGNFKAGEVFVVDDSSRSYLVSATGRVPVYFLPNSGDSSEINVSLAPTADWPNEKMKQALSNKLDASLIQISEIKADLSSGNSEAAIAKAERLVSENPDVAFFKLVRASAFFVGGKTDAAKSDLKEAMKSFPDNAEVKQLAAELNMKTGEQ